MAVLCHRGPETKPPPEIRGRRKKRCVGSGDYGQPGESALSDVVAVLPQASVTVRVAVPEQGLASGQVKVTDPVLPAPVADGGLAADPSEFANVQL